jgi:hypothetical protein
MTWLMVWLMTWLMTWQDTMCYGTVSFVRVRPGYIGTATDNGMPVLLLQGQHLYDNANFALLEIKSVLT